MILLHGMDNRLHVANIRMEDLDVDLLAVDPTEYPWLAVLDSFRLLPRFRSERQLGTQLPRACSGRDSK